MTSSQQKYTTDWLERAQEVRAQARRIKDPEIRREMEIIARLYERLASHAGRRISLRLEEWHANLLGEGCPPAKT